MLLKKVIKRKGNGNSEVTNIKRKGNEKTRKVIKENKNIITRTNRERKTKKERAA